MSTQQTHYEVLQISEEADLTSEYVKHAYRRALLVHHPDKVQQPNAPVDGGLVQTDTGKPTIDQIVQAYSVLSDPSQRKSYDTALNTASGRSAAHHGIDSFDLDDFAYSEKDGHSIWQRDCRCDSEEGYIVTEQDLEQADREQNTQAGSVKELLVGCRGCSLFIRVSFAVSGE